MDDNGSPFLLAIFCTVLLGVYLLPWLIAFGRGHHNTLAIFALNLLGGWTFIGWLISLVWALAAVQKKVRVELRCARCGATSSDRAARFCGRCGAPW